MCVFMNFESICEILFRNTRGRNSVLVTIQTVSKMKSEVLIDFLSLPQDSVSLCSGKIP